MPSRRLAPAEMRALAAKVYEGLSDEQVAEVEAVALERANFMRSASVAEEAE